MRIKKMNRDRQNLPSYTDKKGIRRQIDISRDDLSGAKKPPAWMQEILFQDSPEDAPIASREMRGADPRRKPRLQVIEDDLSGAKKAPTWLLELQSSRGVKKAG